MLKTSPRSPLLLASLSAACFLAVAQTNASAAVTVSIRSNETTVFEGASANLTITRVSDSTSEQGIVVDYSTALPVNLSFEGTANNGNDYTLIQSTITIPAGASSVEVVFAALTDSLIESSVGETARITVSSGNGYTVGTSNTVVQTIVEQRNLPIISVTQTQTIIDEDSAVPVIFTVRRTGATTDALTVPLAISGTATNGADYNSIQGSVTIAGGASSADVSITPIDDTFIEGSEVVRVGIQPSTNNATYTISDVSPRASLEIRDNDIRPVVSVIRGGSDILEGGGTTFLDAQLTQLSPGIRFVIRRTGSTQNQLRVNVATSGTATEGADYFPTNSFVIIPRGQESAIVEIATFTDAIVEGAESVTLTALASPTEYDLASISSASVNILDDDEAPVINIIATDASGAEPSDVIVYQITRSVTNGTADNSQPLTFRYSVTGTAGSADYNALSGVGVIPSGSASTTITVIPTNDKLVEPTESITLSLEAPSGSLYVVGNSSTATGTISDDDVAVTPNNPSTVTLAPTDVAAGESGNNRGFVTVNRTGSVNGNLTVFYNIKGTAVNGKDYKKLSGQITIPAGRSSAVISIIPLADALKEKTESVILSLRVADGYLASKKAIAVAIKDKGNL